MSTPKLRFKEFSGDWESNKLGKISSKPLYGMNASATTFDGENKYLRITDIDEQSHLFNYSKLSSPIGIVEEKYILKEGDILFARTGASTGKSYIYTLNDGKVVFAGFLIKFSLKKVVIPYFIFSQTLLESFNNWVKTNSMRSGQPGINAEEYSQLPIYCTSLPEQTKIANFLTAVDEKISQLSQKQELLSQYKKGMMQKLFSQQIRFKADDGSEFGEWEKSIFKDIADVRDGTHDSPQYIKKGYPLITSKNLKNGKLDFSDINYISKEDYEKFNKRSKVDIGDIVFGMIGTIGNPVLLKSNNFAIKNVALIKQKEALLNIFTIHYLNSQLFNKQISTLNVGNTQKFLALGQIRELIISKPCLPEQTKIANFLSAIDQKIDLTTQQLEQAKQWKKGLLQKMFI